MGRRKQHSPQHNIAEMQPDELNALKAVVQEFITRKQNIENEIAALKEDETNLIEEFKEKLDMKTLQAALRVCKIVRAIEHKDTYDMFIETLQDPAQ